MPTYMPYFEMVEIVLSQLPLAVFIQPPLKAELKSSNQSPQRRGDNLQGRTDITNMTLAFNNHTNGDLL